MSESLISSSVAAPRRGLGDHVSSIVHREVMMFDSKD